jgi:dTDP-4-dehydrorhamnose 3,5-epimerase
MKVTQTAISGCLILEPKIFSDARGYFYESFNQQAFNESTGLDVTFVQDNQSQSVKSVLRGLHYQLPPMAQGKLVRAIRGAILDVAVDIRKNSSTFGQWVGAELTELNHKQLWLPPGMAHGFLVLSDVAEVFYKATNYYSPKDERIIGWNEKTIGIKWPLSDVSQPIISGRDLNGVSFSMAEMFE